MEIRSTCRSELVVKWQKFNDITPENGTNIIMIDKENKLTYWCWYERATYFYAVRDFNYNNYWIPSPGFPEERKNVIRDFKIEELETKVLLLKLEKDKPRDVSIKTVDPDAFTWKDIAIIVAIISFIVLVTYVAIKW